MQVFKNYFKILKKSSGTIILYLAIFTAILVIMSIWGQSSADTSFQQSKLKTVFINNDKDSKLINSLYNTLKKTCEFVDSDKDIDELKDSLFFEEINYVIIIPEGFTQDFYNGKEVNIERMSAGAATTADYITIAINNYMSTAKTFLEASPTISEDQLIKMVENSLDVDIPVTINKTVDNSADSSFLSTYFNYYVYILLAIFIMVISLVMTSYHKLDLKRRNLVAPMTVKKMQLQLFLATLTFTMTITIILTIIGFIISGAEVFRIHSLLYIINALLFALCASSIGFLIAQFSLSSEAASAVSNIVSLGLSFTCGAFVPQFMLSDSLLNVTKFTPAYWFILVNDKLADTATITNSFLQEFLRDIGIVFIFTIAFFGIALVISKANRRKEA